MGARGRLHLDLTALTILAALSNPVVTGVALHIWLGVLVIVPLLVHAILNWSWTVTAIDRFLGRIRPAMRTNVVVDVGLFLSMVATSVSGAMVTPGFALSVGLETGPLWHAVHLASSNMSIFFLIAHVALHVRWMVSTASRTRARNRPPLRPARPAAALAAHTASARGADTAARMPTSDQRGD